MYNIYFYESGHNVMLLNIEGDTRTEVLYTILKENWEQSGEFIVDEEEGEDIFYDFVQMLYDTTKYDWEEGLYMMGFYSEFNLDLSKILDDSYKNVDAEGIIDLFCSCIKEAWEFHNEEFDITYNIEKE